jgi:HTH-type transcriptional regulator, sugar sensing transcriptional regulator
MNIMNTKLLEQIGLTQGETKVYLTLIKLGETKTGPLAREAEVSSSKVYKILDRLIKKGLAGHVIKGKIKYFSALEPKRILEYMDKREQEEKEKKELIKKLIPELELSQKSAKQPEAVVYNGVKGVTNFFRNILDELNKGEEYYVIGATYGENIPGIREFFHNYHKERSSKGIKVKMLANYETKGNIEKTTQKIADIKYLPSHFTSNMQITFYKNKAFIAIWSENPTGFLMENIEAVKSFKSYFETLWKIAKK